MTVRLQRLNMKSSSVIAAVLVGLAVPVAAQQQSPAGLPAQEEALKRNVQVFEMVLREAIMGAGQKVAIWAKQIDPTLSLQFIAQPEVRAVPLMDNSLVFHVDVSELGVSSALWTLQNPRPPQQPPAGPGTRVGGSPAPDAVAAAPVRMTPSQYMTEQVRESLINAILESSTVLPSVGPGQTLTVACNPVDVLVTNPLYRNMSKKLVLQIKGEDLVAMREGKLSREDAKQRIIERRF